MAESVPLSELVQPLAIAIQRGDDASSRLRAQLLGQVSPKRLLLVGGDEFRLAQEERIVVRTLQSGRAFGFETVVREVLDQPVRMYFVDLPAAVEVIRLRKAERLDLLVPAEVRFNTGANNTGDTVLANGNLVDVSGGGCRLFTKRVIPAETVVNVAFQLPGERQRVSVGGSVIEAFTQGSLYGQRVKFFANEKNVDALAEIKRWVQQNLAFADVT